MSKRELPGTLEFTDGFKEVAIRWVYALPVKFHEPG